MVKPTAPRSMLLNSDIKTAEVCICKISKNIKKKDRPPASEKTIREMPAQFIGKACCGGQKVWGDGKGAGCPLHPHYACHACGKILPRLTAEEEAEKALDAAIADPAWLAGEPSA